jgi:hypothetical protein
MLSRGLYEPALGLTLGMVAHVSGSDSDYSGNKMYRKFWAFSFRKEKLSLVPLILYSWHRQLVARNDRERYFCIAKWRTNINTPAHRLVWEAPNSVSEKKLGKHRR